MAKVILGATMSLDGFINDRSGRPDIPISTSGGTRNRGENRSKTPGLW
jgi:hypothetical protein